MNWVKSECGKWWCITSGGGSLHQSEWVGRLWRRCGWEDLKIHMFIQIWKRKCTKANIYDYRGANPNHGGKKGLEQGIGGKINNFLAFKCCITLEEKWDFQLLTIGFVNKLNELADFNCCWIDSWPSSQSTPHAHSSKMLLHFILKFFVEDINNLLHIYA